MQWDAFSMKSYARVFNSLNMRLRHYKSAGNETPNSPGANNSSCSSLLPAGDASQGLMFHWQHYSRMHTA
jgi:hypothetical protein